MSVIRDAVDTWKRRLAELEEQIAPLADEAEQLRALAGRAPRGAPWEDQRLLGLIAQHGR